ncbi:MAG: hypothetical protein HFE59_05065 [Clostridiales bacterium]|nr:hypothetical protein [Clostridiales bacterium]
MNMPQRLSKSKIIFLAVALIIFLATAVWLILSFCETSYRSVKIVETKGSVIIERDDVGKLDAVTNMNLILGDKVMTDKDSYAVLLLDTDKYVHLDSQGEIRVMAEGNETKGKIQIQLEKGTILNEIQNPLGQDSSYEIKTPNATMSVRGTVFETRRNIDDKNIELLVYDGKVALNLVGEGEALYEKGEYTKFEDKENPGFIVERAAITDDVMNIHIKDRLDKILSQGRDINMGELEEENNTEYNDDIGESYNKNESFLGDKKNVSENSENNKDSIDRNSNFNTEITGNNRVLSNGRDIGLGSLGNVYAQVAQNNSGDAEDTQSPSNILGFNTEDNKTADSNPASIVEANGGESNVSVSNTAPFSNLDKPEINDSEKQDNKNVDNSLENVISKQNILQVKSNELRTVKKSSHSSSSKWYTHSESSTENVTSGTSKPTESTTEKTTSGTSKPTETATENTTSGTSKPAESTTEKTTSGTSKPAESTTEKTTSGTSKPTETATENVTSETSKPTEGTTENTTSETSKPTENTTENTTSEIFKPFESSTEKTTSETTIPSESATEGFSEDNTVISTEVISTESSSETASEGNTEVASIESSSENYSENSTEDSTEDSTVEPTVDSSENVTESSTEEISEIDTEESTEETSKDNENETKKDAEINYLLIPIISNNVDLTSGQAIDIGNKNYLVAKNFVEIGSKLKKPHGTAVSNMQLLMISGADFSLIRKLNLADWYAYGSYVPWDFNYDIVNGDTKIYASWIHRETKEIYYPVIFNDVYEGMSCGGCIKNNTKVGVIPEEKDGYTFKYWQTETGEAWDGIVDGPEYLTPVWEEDGGNNN